jgi:hypothetical protein
MSLFTPPLQDARPHPAARSRERTPTFRVPVHPLLLILGISAVLRFWQLGTTPILYFDSGAYLGEGRFLASAAMRAADALVYPAAGAPNNLAARIVQATASGTEGHPPDLAKPGHSILLALAILALGPTTLAAGVVPALAGLGTIAGTYGLGSLLWNRRVAIVGSLLLAFSTEHLVYSREPLVESTGLLFATLATLMYARCVLDPRGGSMRGLCAAGALFGLSFACNNRLAYLPVSLALLELMVWRRDGWRRWQRQVRRAAALCVGFAAPLVLIEAGFLGAQAVAYSAGATPGFLDYAHQFVNFARMNPTSRARLDQWPTFFVDLGLMDGLALLGLFLFGGLLIIARRSRSRCDLLVAAFLLVPLVLFTVYSSGEIRMRNFSYVLPWVMLVAASGLWWIVDRLPHSRLLGAAAIGALVVLALPRDLAVIDAPSAMPDLLVALQDQGNPRAASTNGPVLSYYVGEDRTNARLRDAFINTDMDLAQVTADYPYVVVDMQGYWSPTPITDAASRSVAIFQEPNGNDVLFLADVLESQGTSWGEWADLLDRWNRDRGSATLLRLYRSSDLSGGAIDTTW